MKNFFRFPVGGGGSEVHVDMFSAILLCNFKIVELFRRVGLRGSRLQ